MKAIPESFLHTDTSKLSLDLSLSLSLLSSSQELSKLSNVLEASNYKRQDVQDEKTWSAL